MSPDLIKHMLKEHGKNLYREKLSELDIRLEKLIKEASSIKHQIDIIQEDMRSDDWSRTKKLIAALDLPFSWGYVAKDANGQWWWFDDEPVRKMSGWDYQGDRPSKIDLEDNGDDWHNSLRKV